MKNKKCSMCGETLPIVEFSKDASSKDGLQKKCKNCFRKVRADYYKRNKDKVLKKAAKWRENNPEKVKEMRRDYNNKTEDQKIAERIQWEKDHLKRISKHAEVLQKRLEEEERLKNKKAEWNKNKLTARKQWCHYDYEKINSYKRIASENEKLSNAFQVKMYNHINRSLARGYTPQQILNGEEYILEKEIANNKIYKHD